MPPDALEPVSASTMVMIMPIVGVASAAPGDDLHRMRGSRDGQDRRAAVVTFGRMATAGWRPGWRTMRVAKGAQPATGDDHGLAQLVPNWLPGRPRNNNGPILWIEPETVDLLEADWSSGGNRNPTFAGLRETRLAR
jgi:hypothetical protein